MNVSLKNRVVLVTGAGSGIGLSVATITAIQGATVICADIKDSEVTKKTIVESGGKADAYELDVRDLSHWRSVVESVRSSYGTVNGLCQIAGVVSDGPDTVLEQSDAGWDRLLNTNLRGMWNGMRATLPHMIESGAGNIVNVSSVAGLIGMPNTAGYSASKGAILSLSRQAAMEYAKSNIRVNTISPGTIETPILGDISQETYDVMIAGTPLGKLGKPADVGALAAHLLGPLGEFITGQNFVVDGGWSAN